MAVRTRFFDDHLLDAGRDGLRQFVILASGLDARAYRLKLPPGSTVFEIDQPEVMSFKTRMMGSLGAAATVGHYPLGVDLRGDWYSALAEAGFEPARPSAWIAEGLLGYLPPDAQDRLLDAVTANNAPGSRFATDSLPDFGTMNPRDIERMTRALTEHWGSLGFDIDLAELVCLGERHDVGRYLSERGWNVGTVSTAKLLARCGLAPLEGDHGVPFSDIVYLSATRSPAGPQLR